MKIVGFNLTKISIERKEKIEGQLNINQDINIKSIEKEKIPISKEDALKINFNFSINYSGDIAKLLFEGVVFILPERNELKETLNDWKDKKLNEQIKFPLFNFIMGKCNIKALTLEDDMNLPTHIPMPRLSQEEK